MKRLVAILLLCCLFLTILGYHFIYQFHLQEIKAEMKQYVLSNQHKDVTTFVLSLSDSAALKELQWENQDEFRVNGNMYDVLQKKVENHQLVIYCVPDDKETDLINSYEKINKENNTASHQKWASVLKLITTAFEPAITTPYHDLFIIKQNVFGDYICLLTSYSAHIITPPPQLC